MSVCVCVCLCVCVCPSVSQALPPSAEAFESFMSGSAVPAAYADGE